MNKVIRITQSKILSGLIILLMYSCADKKWDDYYVRPEYLKEGSIMDVLAGIPDYKEFSGLIRKTGYDSLLRRNENYTVFALTNGSFSNIDTTNDIAALKKIIGNHIVPSTLFKDRMGNNYYLSQSGKPLRFTADGSSETVNKILISSFDRRAANGVIHEAEDIIMPLPNIYDYINDDPDFSTLKRYIDSSFVKVVDPEKNVIIGYDTIGNPVYRQPIVYMGVSDYMSLVKADVENSISTVFIPSEDALNTTYSRLLEAREGITDWIIPKLTLHGDTTIAYRFFPKDMAYAGDSAILRDYIFSNTFIPGEVTGINSGDNIFINTLNNRFVVNQTQVEADATIYASNGYIYTLNDITLPGSVYRPTFIFQTLPKIPDPANPALTISNPQIVYRGASNTNPTVTNNAAAFGGKYTQFNFRTIGAEMDITMPYVTSGLYKFYVINYATLGGVGGGVYDFYYETTFLKRSPPVSDSETAASQNFIEEIPVGTINVPASGPVKFTIVCVDRNRSNTNALIYMSALKLVPVDAP